MIATERLAGLSVLVVEDDRDGREMLEQFLSYVGASVTTAASAEEGFELFKAAPPAIVVKSSRSTSITSSTSSR